VKATVALIDHSLRPAGFARAFGRAVGPSARLFMARVNACPSVLDHCFEMEGSPSYQPTSEPSGTRLSDDRLSRG
jgi:hypothetical protein